MNDPLHPCVEALMSLAYGTGEECRWCKRFAGLDHASECPVTLMASNLARTIGEKRAAPDTLSEKPGLDVERLSEALEGIGVIANGTWVSFQPEDAEKIIREYNRLGSTDSEGRYPDHPNDEFPFVAGVPVEGSGEAEEAEGIDDTGLDWR